MPALSPTIYGFLLTLLRSAGLCAFAPVLGSRNVPARVRLGLSVVVAVVAYVGAGTPQVPAAGPGVLIACAASEAVLGLCAGVASRFALDAAVAAGHLAGLSMGMGYGALIDPVNGAESTAVGQLLSALALVAVVALGVHREAIAWFSRSVITFPPGTVVDMASLAQAVVTQAIGSVMLAVRLGFPVLVAVTFGHVALGVLGRTAPQVSLSSVGFSIAVLCGGGALYLVAPGAAELAAHVARDVLVRGL
jgi:flagellar biosynthesis protein FliR